MSGLSRQHSKILRSDHSTAVRCPDTSMCLAHVHSADANSKAGWAGLFHQVLSYLMSELLLNLKTNEKCSTTRSYFDSPITPLDTEGSTPIYAFPYIGMR